MQYKHFLVYKITNKTNGKFYIGCHETYNPDDGYMGSGKLIKKAILKYGIENFNKDILSFFDCREDMYDFERIEIERVKPEYNLAIGGRGGFAYINSNNLANNVEHGKLANEALKKRLSEDPILREQYSKRGSETFKRLHAEGKLRGGSVRPAGWKHTDEARLKISKALSGRQAHNKGTPMSEETKKKISRKLRFPRGECGVCSSELGLHNKTGFCINHKNSIPQEKIDEIKKLRKTMTLRQIAPLYGVSFETIRRISNR